ncbi:hypothetical protein ICE98_01592 [Lactococcus lactis]|nr:hypothetical protein [Lactococcus lactis]
MDTTVINKNTTTMKTISLKSWLTDITSWPSVNFSKSNIARKTI